MSIISNNLFVKKLAENSIWLFAFGYFACYVPYSFMTKVLSKGLIPSLNGQSLAGFSILPVSGIATLLTMLIFITLMGWWKYASHTKIMGLNIPHPTRWTFLSGLCTSLIIGTTTLAYTFESVSIVFAMLLMRGGILIIAPIIDAISKRHVRWFAWAGLVGAMCALLISLLDTDGYNIPFLCAIYISIYIASYFIRFQFMSKLAKTEKKDTNLRYFVEEQMVSTPTLVIILVLTAILGRGEISDAVRCGFSAHWGMPYLWAIIIVGVFSQGTGIFGTLVFLDKSENTYCIPINRASSILAGVIATYLLTMYSNQHAPHTSQLIGAGFIVISILFMSIPPMLANRETCLQHTEQSK